MTIIECFIGDDETDVSDFSVRGLTALGTSGARFNARNKLDTAGAILGYVGANAGVGVGGPDGVIPQAFRVINTRPDGRFDFVLDGDEYFAGGTVVARVGAEGFTHKQVAAAPAVAAGETAIWAKTDGSLQKTSNVGGTSETLPLDRARPSLHYPVRGAAGAFASNLRDGNFLGTGAFNGNVQYAPFIPANDITFDALSYEVTVAAGAGGVGRIGVYDANQDTGYPTALIVETGSFATTSTGAKTTAVAPTTLRAGRLYFVAWLAAVSGATLRVVPVTAIAPHATATAVDTVSGFYYAFLGNNPLPANAAAGMALLGSPPAVIRLRIA